MNISKISQKVTGFARDGAKHVAKAATPAKHILENEAKLTSALDCMASNAVVGINRTQKSKELPEFLYHITSKKNYEGMLKDGKMNLSLWENEANGLPGIYMVDKNNFLNKWMHTKIDKTKILEEFGANDLPQTTLGEDLINFLLLKASGENNSLVAIKIPTAELSSGNFRFRPYREVASKPIDVEKIFAKVCETDVDLSKCNDIDSLIKQASSKSGPAIKQDALIAEGLDIKNIGKYYDTEPLEYIYNEPITASHLKQYSEAKELTSYINADNTFDIKSFVQDLFSV